MIIARHTMLLAATMLCVLTACQPEDKQQEPAASPDGDSASDNPQVAILGTFHFGGSSGDLASINMEQPLGARRQGEIKELVALLKAYKPTKVLVEYPRYSAAKLQQRYDNYLSGKDTLRVSETYQVGFRLAEQMGHESLYPIDYNVNLPAEGMVAYCQRNGKMDEFQGFIDGIKAHVQSDDAMLDTLTITQFLKHINTDEIDRITNDTYLGLPLNWGDSTAEAGAHFAATWWERNFVILRNIGATLTDVNDRVLVIIGSGHRAVLKDLVIDRSDMDYVEIGDYLN